MWPHVWHPHYVIKEHDTPAVPNLKRKEKKIKKEVLLAYQIMTPFHDTSFEFTESDQQTFSYFIVFHTNSGFPE